MTDEQIKQRFADAGFPAVRLYRRGDVVVAGYITESRQGPCAAWSCSVDGDHEGLLRRAAKVFENHTAEAA